MTRGYVERFLMEATDWPSYSWLWRGLIETTLSPLQEPIMEEHDGSRHTPTWAAGRRLNGSRGQISSQELPVGR